MPRLLIRVHQSVLVLITDCWRQPLTVGEPPDHEISVPRLVLTEGQVPLCAQFLSCAPSVTRKSTSCGVSPEVLVPLPGSGIAVLMLVKALSKSVSVSLL